MTRRSGPTAPRSRSDLTDPTPTQAPEVVSSVARGGLARMTRAEFWPRGVRPFGLTDAELAAEISRCRAAGWMRWELLARFGRVA